MLANEKRRVILLLRWALMLSLSYLMVFSARAGVATAGVWVALLLASNLILARLPESVFHLRAFDPTLLLVDLTLTTTGLVLCGASGPDFFFLFFFVIFIASLGGRPELSALGAALAAIGYLCLVQRDHGLDAAILLRVPFLFITGLTYGYLASTARAAQARTDAVQLALGRMSREMRTPLGFIMRYSEALNADRLQNLTPAQREAVGEINTQAVELLELVVGRLLDILDGKMPLDAPTDEPQPTPPARATMRTMAMPARTLARGLKAAS